MPFTLPIDTVIHAALLEDLGQGDVTTDALPFEDKPTTAVLATREACVVSGLAVARRVFGLVDDSIRFEPLVSDGQMVQAGEQLAVIQGNTAEVLKAERTALNFLQHLSGIATETRRYSDAVAGTGARITDTRKTTPGLRFLEKQAVRHGGGFPHRFNLGSAAMLKDNHLQAVGGIEPAVQLLREKLSHTCRIEVEVEDMAGVAAALNAGADIIMLDNMTPEQVREAVSLIQNRAITEASGRISLETVRAYAETGVQYLSTSKITLGARPVDIGLDFQ
jgi:nicotinate-nucleotide pyrophosphorylase (carboxylating)